MKIASRGWRWPATMLAIVLGVAMGMAGGAEAANVHDAAGFTPNEMITYRNAAKVKKYVSPGVYYKVVHGMSMRITPTTRIMWPPPYETATEKYADQVRLSPNGRSLVNYVAGQPFPFLDPNDPNIAEKIMWNTEFKPISTDDYDLRYFDCDSERSGLNKPYRPIDYFQVGHYAGYAEIGRTEVEPLPIDPDFKITHRYWLFALYPILAPSSLRGSGLIRWRYAKPTEQDAIWDWNPGTRRIRRLDNSIMSDSVTNASASMSSDVTVFDPNHYGGFNAKLTNYNYKFLGERSMLASVNAIHSPEITCATDGGASACPENWQMRKLYIVQVTPRDIVTADHSVYSKSILYVDSEAWFEPYTDEYDQQGQLWRNYIYWLTYRDRPVPDARIAIYPFKREFVLGAASTDVQSGMATMCYLPGQHTPERECWYINMGAVGRDFFTTQAMVQAAP